MRLLFKLTSVNSKLTGNHRNLDKVPGIITVVRISGTKALDFIKVAKDSFLKLQMAQVESPNL